MGRHRLRIFALVLVLVTPGFGQENRLSTTRRVPPFPETAGISPALTYSSYLGGSESDFAKGIAVDEQGYIYLTGTTSSADFPVAFALQDTSAGHFDIFVTKLDLETNTVIFSTYIGGSGVDSGNSLAVDRDGAIYVTGNTSSRDFPITNAFQSDYGGGAFDAFVIKLVPNGNELEYSTYLGGALEDFGADVQIDSEGNAYLTGRTASANFPLERPIQARFGGLNDAFIAKLNADGRSLSYSTYWGSSGNDIGNGVDIDAGKHLYVTGTTVNLNQGVDLFVNRVTADGSAFAYSKLIGTTSTDLGNAIAVNDKDETFITGITLVGPNGGDDAFVIHLDSRGEIVYAEFIGGREKDVGNRIAIDNDGRAVIVGRTASPDFPIAGAFQPVIGGAFDGFVARLDDAGKVIMASFIGGSGGSIVAETGDNAQDLALDSYGNIYVSGHSRSLDFPTVEPFQPNHGGGDNDGFLVRISPMATSVPAGPPPAQTSTFELIQNYPNPFNPVTTIGFRLAKRSQVELTVFDVTGNRVAILVNEERAPGYHQATFEATNLASGVYFYRLRVGTVVQERKMLLIR